MSDFILSKYFYKDIVLFKIIRSKDINNEYENIVEKQNNFSILCQTDFQNQFLIYWYFIFSSCNILYIMFIKNLWKYCSQWSI